jgi:hypothetical protein
VVSKIRVLESVNQSTAGESKFSSPEYASHEGELMSHEEFFSVSVACKRGAEEGASEDFPGLDLGDSPDFSPGKRGSKVAGQNGENESNNVFVEHLKQGKQRGLVVKIEDRCMELVRQVAHDISMVNYNQASMGLAIIRYVRREFGVKNSSPAIDSFLNNQFQLDRIFFKNEYQILKLKYGDPKVSPNNSFTAQLRQNPINFILKAPHIIRQNRSQYHKGKSITTSKTTLPANSMQEISRFGIKTSDWLEDSDPKYQNRNKSTNKNTVRVKTANGYPQKNFTTIKKKPLVAESNISPSKFQSKLNFRPVWETSHDILTNSHVSQEIIQDFEETTIYQDNSAKISDLKTYDGLFLSTSNILAVAGPARPTGFTSPMSIPGMIDFEDITNNIQELRNGSYVSLAKQAQLKGFPAPTEEYIQNFSNPKRSESKTVEPKPKLTHNPSPTAAYNSKTLISDTQTQMAQVMDQLSFLVRKEVAQAQVYPESSEPNHAQQYTVTGQNNKTYIGKNQCMTFKSKCLNDYSKISQWSNSNFESNLLTIGKSMGPVGQRPPRRSNKVPISGNGSGFVGSRLGRQDIFNGRKSLYEKNSGEGLAREFLMKRDPVFPVKASLNRKFY